MRALTAGLLLAIPLSLNAQGREPLVEFENMTWVEVKNAIAAGRTTALYYTGGTEQRGPQNTNGGHNYMARATNKAIALAFCQQQRFTEVTKVDTETRKGKAARLDGQFCSKNKCKVFDEIVCKK